MAKTKVSVPVQIESRTKKEKVIIEVGEHEFTDKQLEDYDGLYSIPGMLVSDDDPGAEKAKAEAEERANLIIEAIGQIDPEQRENFTEAGAPKVLALEAVINFDITEAERDAAWAFFKAETGQADNQ